MTDSNLTRKDVYSFSLDSTTVENLRILADRETEGNMSQMIRRLVRNAIAAQVLASLPQQQHAEVSA